MPDISQLPIVDTDACFPAHDCGRCSYHWYHGTSAICSVRLFNAHACVQDLVFGYVLYLIHLGRLLTGLNSLFMYIVRLTDRYISNREAAFFALVFHAMYSDSNSRVTWLWFDYIQFIQSIADVYPLY